MFSMNNLIIRKAVPDDFTGIKRLYSTVAEKEGGIARLSSEVTDDYVKGFIWKSHENGIILIAESDAVIVAEIHAYRSGIKVFEHVLSDLTIVVSDEYQGKGIGKKLFLEFLETVKKQFTTIARVELIARESNQKAIQFYESIGFTIEGRFEKRIKTTMNTYEADIPMAWFNPNYKIV